MNTGQPWIAHRRTEIIFILLPPFLSLLLVILFPTVFAAANELSDYWWVMLILLVDVSHVYSTLYRTYFDKITFSKQKNRLVVIPLMAFVIGVLLYSIDPLYFWRILAYTAVFHFIRQQYGFMRVYSSKETASALYKKIDTLTIYCATLYPIIFWHLSSDRKFNWFVAGDFLKFDEAGGWLTIFSTLYFIVMTVYVCKEIVSLLKGRKFNIPRNAVIVGTGLSWYFGIIVFNGDLAFTLLNVVSHGVPYMALVWLYGKKQ